MPERPGMRMSDRITSKASLRASSNPSSPVAADWTAEPAANRTAIVEFRVDDVDAEFARLRDMIGEFVQEPTTMPWGNRSLLFRDPDGTLVNLFTPISTEATARQQRCSPQAMPAARRHDPDMTSSGIPTAP